MFPGARLPGLMQSLDDHRDTPGVLVEVLFSLQPVAADGDAVVGGVEDVGVFKLAHFLKPCENAADLDVDDFRAGVVAADLVADRRLVAAIQHAADRLLVAHVAVGVVEWMGGQPVGRQRRLFGVGGRAG